MVFTIVLFFISSYSAEMELLWSILFYLHISFFIFLDIFLLLGIIRDKFRIFYVIYLITSGYIIFSLTVLLPFGIYPSTFDPPIGHFFVILSFFIYVFLELLFIFYLRQRDPKSRLDRTIYFGSIVTLTTILTPIIFYSSYKFPTLGGTYDYLLLATQLLFLLSLLPFCSALWLCANNVLYSQEKTNSEDILLNTLFKLTKNYGREILSFPVFFFALYSAYETYFLIFTHNVYFTTFLILGGAILSLIGYILLFTNYAVNKYLFYIIIIGGSLISVGIAIETLLYPSFLLWLTYFPTVILIVTCLFKIIEQFQKSGQI